MESSLANLYISTKHCVMAPSPIEKKLRGLCYETSQSTLKKTREKNKVRKKINKRERNK